MRHLHFLPQRLLEFWPGRLLWDSQHLVFVLLHEYLCTFLLTLDYVLFELQLVPWVSVVPEGLLKEVFDLVAAALLQTANPPLLLIIHRSHLFHGRETPRHRIRRTCERIPEATAPEAF